MSNLPPGENPVKTNLPAQKAAAIAARDRAQARGKAQGIPELTITTAIKAIVDPCKVSTAEDRFTVAAAAFDALWPAADLAMAEAFIGHLTGSPDGHIRLRFLHQSDAANNSPRENEGRIADLWPQVQEHQRKGYSVFYFVNEITRGLEGFASDGDATAVGCRAFAIDADKGLPEIYEWHLSPSLIVKTSRVTIAGAEIQKGQALWLLESSQAIAGFRPGQKRLALRYASDSAICNESRVLRLPGTLHLKDPTRPQLVTFEGSGARFAPEAVLKEIAELPAREKKAATGTGKRVTWENLRIRLSYIHPAFNGTRPYSTPDIKTLPYDGPAWLAIGLALRDGNIPLFDDEEHDWLQLIAEWSNGTLWFERTGEKLAIESLNLPPQGTDLRLQGASKTDKPTTIATVIKYAADGGCPLPPDDETRPSASETFKEALGDDAPPFDIDPAEWKRLRHKYRLRDPVEEANRPPLTFWDETNLFIRTPEGAILFLYGDSGTHKTNLLLMMTLWLVFNHSSKPRVAFFTGEGAYAFGQSRISTVCKHYGKTVEELKATGQFHQVSAAPELMSDRDMAAVAHELKTFRPNIIVVETFSRSVAGNYNSPDVFNKAYSAIDALRRQFNALVAISHHEGKDAAKGMSGNKQLGASPDTVLYASKLNDTTVELFVEKMRDGKDEFSVGFRVLRSANGVPVLTVMSEADFASAKAGASEAQTTARDDTQAIIARACALLTQLKAIDFEHGVRDTQEFARLLTEGEHGRQPSESQPDLRQEWNTKCAKLYDQLRDGSRRHGKSDKIRFAAIGDKQAVNGSNIDQAWRWFTNFRPAKPALSVDDPLSADSFRTMQ